MFRQEKARWKCVGRKPGMCEHTFPLYSSTAVVAIFRFAYVCMHYFYCGEKQSIKSVGVIVSSGLSLNP